VAKSYTSNGNSILRLMHSINELSTKKSMGTIAPPINLTRSR
jgi:hypothetical protein